MVKRRGKRHGRASKKGKGKGPRVGELDRNKAPMAYLPIEIIEEILLLVPVQDMIFTEPWVCKSWTQVLHSPGFWFQKMKKINFTLDIDMISVLEEFDSDIQAILLYRTCLCLEKKFGSNEVELMCHSKEMGLHLEGMSPFTQREHESYMETISDDDNKGILMVAGDLLATRAWLVVEIILVSKVGAMHKVARGLPPLLKIIAATKSVCIVVDVYDDYGFWNFTPGYDYVSLLKGPDKKVDLKIILGSLNCTNENIRYAGHALSYTDKDDRTKSGFIGFYPVLVLHVKAGTDMTDLTYSLGEHHHLIISELDKIHEGWLVSLAFHLKKEFYQYGYFYKHQNWLILHSCKLGLKSTETLIERLLRIISINVMCSPAISNTWDKGMLNSLRKSFREFKVQWFESNEKLMRSSVYKKLDSMENSESRMYFCYNCRKCSRESCRKGSRKSYRKYCKLHRPTYKQNIGILSNILFPPFFQPQILL